MAARVNSASAPSSAPTAMEAAYSETPDKSIDAAYWPLVKNWSVLVVPTTLTRTAMLFDTFVAACQPSACPFTAMPSLAVGLQVRTQSAYEPDWSMPTNTPSVIYMTGTCSESTAAGGATVTSITKPLLVRFELKLGL